MRRTRASRPSGPARGVFAVVLAGSCLTALGDARSYSPATEYALHCQGCHLVDGSATAGAVPALRGSVGRFLAVGGGRDYLVQVPGVAQADLDDATLAALLNWVVERFDSEHLPADFLPFQAAEVGRLRRTPLVDVEGTRRRVLAIPLSRP